MKVRCRAGLENGIFAFNDGQYAQVLRHAMEFAQKAIRDCSRVNNMTKDYRYSLLAKRDRLDREIADAETQMKETIPLKDWRRLSNLLALLRFSREELQIELDGLGHAKTIA